MKRTHLALVILLAFIAGAAVGYYFGYDHGFERAVRTLRP